MKISYNWLADVLPKLTASPYEVAQLLTMHSFETEVVGTLSIDPTILIAKIQKLEPHPNADRLRLATITDGQKAVTVVCGAPNISVGDVVPYAPPGARLQDDKGHKITVREATIRGVTSPGMLNSLRELGLSHDHSGIWLLPHDAAIGASLTEQFPDDTILEADLTPNRAHDCFSHIGIARELAALLQLEVAEPAMPQLPTPQAGSWTVTIADQRLCSRYVGVALNGLTSAPSPLWLQARLIAAGGKPINNIVDITNYVLFEYGNPTHLFDSTKLPGQHLSIRPALSGETLVTLDEQERSLSSDDLVIAADSKPVALAGVIGGQASQVSPSTTDGFLEVANFNAYSTQETSRRLNVRTEASLRFSKGIDPNLVEHAARRAVSLLANLAHGTVQAVVDQYPEPLTPKTIAFSPDRVTQVAGALITEQQSLHALQRIRCQVQEKNIPWQVIVPTDRRDIAGEHDLVEEVIRIVGLDEIAAAPLQLESPVALSRHMYWREVVRTTLVELGLSEVYNSAFEPGHYARLAGVADQEHITVANPPAPELSQLRVSLLPGLLANLVTNRESFHRNANRKESALFEIGRVYRPGDGGQVTGVVEEEYCAGVIVGGNPALEKIAQTLSEKLGLAAMQLANKISDTGREELKYRVPLTAFSLNLTELLQQVEADSAPARTLDDIKEHPVATEAYQPIPKYPAAYRDLSLQVSPDVSIEQVQEVIERIGGDVVVDVDLFDVYNPTAEEKQGLAFHIAYQSPDKTLTDDEVAQAHNAIIASLKTELAAELKS